MQVSDDPLPSRVRMERSSIVTGSAITTIIELCI